MTGRNLTLMKTQTNAVFCWACFCLLPLAVSSASGQLLNAPGQVWTDGSSQGANYVEIQVTQVTPGTFAGLASFKLNGEWIAQEQSFSGTQQVLAGGVLQLDATCDLGTRFSGWLFPGSDAGTNSDDRICVYFTAGTSNEIPCASDSNDANAILHPSSA